MDIHWFSFEYTSAYTPKAIGKSIHIICKELSTSRLKLFMWKVDFQNDVVVLGRRKASRKSLAKSNAAIPEAIWRQHRPHRRSKKVRSRSRRRNGRVRRIRSGEEVYVQRPVGDSAGPILECRRA